MRLLRFLNKNILLLFLVLSCIGLTLLFYNILSPEFLWARSNDIEFFIQNRTVLSKVLFCLFYISLVVFSVPAASILTLVSGYFFGFPIGGFLSFISAFSGATFLYILVRAGLRDRIAKKLSLHPAFQDIEFGFQSNATNYLLFTRLFPFVPFWMANLAPAVLGVRFKTFAITTFLGILPGTLAIAFLGSQLKTVIANQEGHTFSSELDKTTLAALSVVSISILVPIFVRILKK